MTYNVLFIIKAAMRRVYGEQHIEEAVSGYYFTGKIARTVEGIGIALPEEARVYFREMPEKMFIQFLRQLMKNVV